MSDISGIVEHFPYAGLFVLLILGGIGLPLPEDTTLMLCGFLISHNVIQPIPAFTVVYPGILATDFLLYSVGRKYGRAVITRKRFSRLLSQERISIIEKKFEERGVPVILLGRHLVGLRAQLFLVAGIMRMPAAKFLAADAVSALFTMALMVGAGYAGGYSLQVIEKDITRIEHLAVLIGVISLAICLIFRYLKVRQK